MKVKIINLPSERALINANNGIDDGNYARVEGLEKQYPNLVMVPEPITQFEFVAISKKQNLIVHNWESLRPYHVGYITGWKIVEANVKNVKSITAVSDEDQLFNLLLSDKVDIVIYDRKQGEYLIRKMGYHNLHVYDTQLAKRDMFVYMNRKHEGIAAKLSDAIRSLKKDGLYKKILDESLKMK